MKHIHAALGVKFEILSLLDYIRLTMEKLLKIDEDYTLLERKYYASIDKKFRYQFFFFFLTPFVNFVNFSICCRISFPLISVKLTISWVFTIDVSDYDNINKNMVSYYSRVGDLRERDIQKCLNECPKGFRLVRCFVETLYKWVEDLERK